MDDLLKSIKAHLHDKATSPLFGTFAVTWIVWNYKFIMVLFSSFPVDKKFEYISTHLYPFVNSYLSRGVLFPLLTTIFFIFVYPYPAKWVYSFVRNQQRQLLEIKAKIEDETPLTVEDSRNIRRELTRLVLEHEKELEAKNSEILKLKTLIENFQNDEPPIEEISSKSPQLNGEQLRMLVYISENEKISLFDLVHALGLQEERVRAQFNFGELEKKELIYRPSSQEPNGYSITHTGREVLVDANLV